MATKSRPRSTRTREAAAKTATSGAGVFILLLLGVLLSVHLAKIYLGRRTTLMGVEWETKSKQLAILKKEQINLQMEKETYTDPNYILRHASEMGLAPTQAGQVRRISETPEPMPAKANIGTGDQAVGALPAAPAPAAVTPAAAARSQVASAR